MSGSKCAQPRLVPMQQAAGWCRRHPVQEQHRAGWSQEGSGRTRIFPGWVTFLFLLGLAEAVHAVLVCCRCPTSEGEHGGLACCRTVMYLAESLRDITSMPDLDLTTAL